MAHHKRKRPKQRRGGCLLCKPHKLTANAKSERRKGRRDWTLNKRAAGDHGDRNQLYLNTGLKRVGNAPGWIRTSDRRIRSSAGRCPRGQIWPDRADHVQGVRLSSLELGTNFGTKFSILSEGYVSAQQPNVDPEPGELNGAARLPVGRRAARRPRSRPCESRRSRR